MRIMIGKSSDSNETSRLEPLATHFQRGGHKTIATVPGDYDGSGVANGADLLFFQQSDGQTGPSLPADGNGDHVVDKFDLDMWETSMTLGLTTTAGAQASQDGAVTAPEPTSVVLFLMSASFLRLRRAHVL